MRFSQKDVEEMLAEDEPYKYPPKEYDPYFMAFWTRERSVKLCVARVLETGLPQIIETSCGCYDYKQRFGLPVQSKSKSFGMPIIVCLSKSDVRIPENDVLGIIEVSKYNLTPLGVISLQSKIARCVVDNSLSCYGRETDYRRYMGWMRYGLV